MMRVEQAKLLAAMHGIEGVIDIEHDAPRHLAEALAIVLDHGVPHAQQRTCIGQVLGARDGRLRAQVAPVRQTLHRQLEHRVVPQRVGVVAEHHAGEVEAEHGVGRVEAGAGLGEGVVEVARHAGRLRALAGKEEGGFHGVWGEG